MKRKLMSLLLCAATVMGSVALLASCADGEASKTTGPNTDIEKPAGERFLEKLPDGLNFASEGLTDDDLILYVAYTEGANGLFTQRSLKAEEEDESPVDQKTFERDNRLKTTLGLELEIEQIGTGIADMEGQIGTSLEAGSPDYDILAGYQYFGIGMAKRGILLNLANLAQDGADYIDFDAPYWGKSYNDNMSYKGAYYWITGDLALRYIGGMYCTFVNSEIYNTSLQKDYGSIYDIAKKGEWTLDKLYEMTSKIYEDNGDVVEEPDAADTFGFGWEGTDMMDGIATGAGVQFTFKNPETGDVQLTFNNKRTYDISDKLNALSILPNSFKFDDADSANVMTAFSNGTVAFTVNKLYQAETFLDEFENFYIIPAPKFDTTQTNYITGLHDGCTIFGITSCTPKVRQAAAALEFLCAYSSKDVRPVYYEGALKTTYTRDKEAAEMVDLIHSNISTDFALAWGNSIHNIGWSFRQCAKISGSSIKREIPKWEEAIKTLGESLIKHKDGGVEAE